MKKVNKTKEYGTLTKAKKSVFSKRYASKLKDALILAMIKANSK